ncbi:MAG: CoB--CoM heterodisulfide reductase iron-sulfur subunit B family protein [Planctomycetota bacterium]
MEVSFYPGCTAHSTGIEYSLSTHAVFDALGVTLTEIDDWNCCGGAAAHSLSHMLGLALPARNIAKAQVRDLPLAIPCPGCFNAVKRAQYALSNDPEMREKLEDVVGFKYKGGLEVKPMHDVILKDIGVEKLKEAVKRPLTGLRVVSYYGCALVRDPKVVEGGDHENPLFLDEIVEALGGCAQDWSYKTDCCGADLAMTHGKIATEITDKITGMALEADADCVMASCGLCQINLDMRQSGANGARLPVFYFTELMGIAMDLPGRDEWWDKHIVSPRPLLRSRNLL